MLDSIHLIATDCALSDGFFGVYTGDSREHWLLPFDRREVGQVDWNSILSLGAGNNLPGFLEIKETGLGSNRTIKLKAESNGQTWQQSYSQKDRNAEMNGNSLDIRIWPNFCFPAAPMLPANPGDRSYYFRIRQDPGWNLSPLALARVRDDAGKVTGCELLRLETTMMLPQNPDRFRRARFYSLPAEGAKRPDNSICQGHAEPIGLYFENRGLLLFRLYTLPFMGNTGGAAWRAGIDFGTSNTCVAFLPLAPGLEISPKIGPLGIQTATMHAAPYYEEILLKDPGMESEGAAAIFDFPYRYGMEDLLTERFYFPSQFVTRLAEPPAIPDFRFEHGFIFPRNAVLDNHDARVLLDGHPPLPRNEHRVFHLIQDVKWSNRAYRTAFLWHLYKILIIHAARCGAYLAEVAFSFPRAFDPDAVRHYRNEATGIFTQHGGIRLHQESFVSESVAVQRRVRAETLRWDRMVLDVGGGTTDYTALLAAAEPFQASYCLAARYVNEYFRASRTLRRALRDVTYDTLGAPKSNKEGDQRGLLDDLLEELEKLDRDKVAAAIRERIGSYSQAAFFGLLGMVNDDEFAALAPALASRAQGCKEEKERKSLCGFFLTLVVLYTAIAYQGARLFQQHRRPGPNMKLDFIGNGSRHLLLLNSDRKSAQVLLERVVQSIWPPVNGEKWPLEVRLEISSVGKAFVAEGLVLGNAGVVPAETVPDVNATELFLKLQAKPGTIIPVQNLEFKKYISDLTGWLPGGKLALAANTETVMIPFLESGREATFIELADTAVAEARGLIHDNAKEHAKWREKADSMRAVNPGAEHGFREAAASVEPVFVTCVRCLLDEVRKHFAT